MGTPEFKNYLASLLDFAGFEIARLVRHRVPTDRKILDVGAGWAKYRILLNEYAMDAVEIWKPYVEKHRLMDHYDSVHVMKAVDFQYPQRYGAVIMGDVLEHMPVKDAQAVIRAACGNADLVIVVVPFLMEQHEEEGNPYEAHVQDDLTEELMTERYPQLSLLVSNGHKGIYVSD